MTTALETMSHPLVLNSGLFQKNPAESDLSHIVKTSIIVRREVFNSKQSFTRHLSEQNQVGTLAQSLLILCNLKISYSFLQSNICCQTTLDVSMALSLSAVYIIPHKRKMPKIKSCKWYRNIFIDIHCSNIAFKNWK